MASKLFKNEGKKYIVTTNRAGGKAVELSAKETLAKYIVTCTFNNTYYATGEEHLDELKSTINSIANSRSSITLRITSISQPHLIQLVYPWVNTILRHRLIL